MGLRHPVQSPHTQYDTKSSRSGLDFIILCTLRTVLCMRTLYELGGGGSPHDLDGQDICELVLFFVKRNFFLRERGKSS